MLGKFWVSVGFGFFFKFDSELDEFRFPNFLFELPNKFSRPLMNTELNICVFQLFIIGGAAHHSVTVDLWFKHIRV